MNRLFLFLLLIGNSVFGLDNVTIQYGNQKAKVIDGKLQTDAVINVGTVTVAEKTSWSNYEVNTSLTAGGNDSDLGTTTVSVATRLQGVKFTASGSARAVLVIGGINKAELVTSPSCRTDSIAFSTPLLISAGQYVCVNVTNEDNVNTQRVSVTLIGYQP